MSDSDGIDVDCPGCNQRLRLPVTAAGTHISCPDCNASIEVPATGIAKKPQWAWPKQGQLGDEADERPRRDYDHPRQASIARSDASGVMAPAICMIVVASLGVLLNFFNCVDAIVHEAPPVNPQDPLFMQQIQINSYGAVPAIFRAVLGLISAGTIVGSIQMLRCRQWGLALTAGVLSIVNIGGGCCLLGLPFGIWALVVLARPEVRAEFESRAIERSAPTSRRHDRW
jgi:hypothetical protein